MPETLAAALAIPALWPLIAVAGLAGVVYGFAGFGSALVFMPVATIWLAPEEAVAAFSLSALASLVTVVPRAWKVADKPETLTLLAAAVLATAPGVYLLRSLDDTLIRWLVTGLVAVTLAGMVGGLRYAGRPGHGVRVGIGAAAGLVGGATGLAGPIVILFHLGGAGPAIQTRANTLVFLTLLSILMLPQMAAQGALSGRAVWLGLILLIPYGVGSRTGQALFRPGHEALYRLVAYTVIGVAVLAGMPI